MYTDLFFFLEVLLEASRGHLVRGTLFGDERAFFIISSVLYAWASEALTLELFEAVYKYTTLNALHSR